MMIDFLLQLQTWVTQIVLTRLSQHSNMGTTLTEGQDFLEIHEHLEEDISVSTYTLGMLGNFSRFFVVC